VYWADTYYPDIYGHVLLEVLPQLWGYREAGVEKVATSVLPDRTFLAMLQALGVAPEAILTVDRCIAPTEAYVATPPVMLRDYVHPEASEIFERLGQLGKASDAATPERLYVSRSRARRRALRNEAEIEAIFEEEGFLIYHPQEHLIEDQIRTFSQARLIAGPGGSALHNSVFSERLEQMLILSSPAWFTIIDLLLHQKKGRLALLFGDVVDAPLLKQQDRDWTIPAHQVRLTLRFHMGL
jgi:capsular polysaccharide biosynthesis protein